MSKILAQSIFSIGRPNNDTRINASNVSSSNWLQQSLFTQFCLENPRSHIVVLAKPKLQSVLSWSCKVKITWLIGIWKCVARVPRLESSYVSICKLQPLYCVTCNFWRGLHCEGWKLCKAHFCEVPQKKTLLTAKIAFDRCWRLQYWTLTPILVGISWGELDVFSTLRGLPLEEIGACQLVCICSRCPPTKGDNSHPGPSNFRNVHFKITYRFWPTQKKNHNSQ